MINFNHNIIDLMLFNNTRTASRITIFHFIQIFQYKNNQTCTCNTSIFPSVANVGGRFSASTCTTHIFSSDLPNCDFERGPRSNGELISGSFSSRPSSRSTKWTRKRPETPFFKVKLRSPVTPGSRDHLISKIANQFF